MIHVCSLARLHETVEETGARHIVTLINDETLVVRPECVSAENHLFLGMHDIPAEMDGFRAPAKAHVQELIDFVQRWDRSAPLVVHCYAGISRSTAAAFVIACALNPQRDERAIARSLRDASATAIPNTRLVSLADEVLGRQGRMVSAIESIGRGAESAEGTPFRLDIE
jgi:predicted protein tyrosine phosphatase